MVPGAALGIDDARRGILPHPRRPALMRRHPPVEEARQHHRKTGRPHRLLHLGGQRLVGGHVRAPPVKMDLSVPPHHAALGHRLDPAAPLGRHPSQQLHVAERRPARAVREIPVIQSPGLLVDGVVAKARIDRDHRARVVVHEMPPDLVVPVRHARAEEKRRALHRARRDGHDPGPQHLPVIPQPHVHLRDRAVVLPDDEPFDLRPRAPVRARARRSRRPSCRS